MIVVATGGRNRFHLVRQSLQDLSRSLYTQILWLPCIWPSGGTNQTAVFQRLSIRLPTGCLSRFLAIAMHCANVFWSPGYNAYNHFPCTNHPPTTIDSRHSMASRSPTAVSTSSIWRPWFPFFVSSPLDMQPPLLFRHLATIMPRGRTSTPIELKHTSIHCIYSTIWLLSPAIHQYLAPIYRNFIPYTSCLRHYTPYTSVHRSPCITSPSTSQRPHPISFFIPLASTSSMSSYSDCMYQVCNRRTGSPVFHSIHSPYICRLQAARLVPRIGIRPASLQYGRAHRCDNATMTINWLVKKNWTRELDH